MTYFKILFRNSLGATEDAAAIFGGGGRQGLEDFPKYCETWKKLRNLFRREVLGEVSGI